MQLISRLLLEIHEIQYVQAIINPENLPSPFIYINIWASSFKEFFLPVLPLLRRLRLIRCQLSTSHQIQAFHIDVHGWHHKNAGSYCTSNSYRPAAPKTNNSVLFRTHLLIIHLIDRVFNCKIFYLVCQQSKKIFSPNYLRFF